MVSAIVDSCFYAHGRGSLAGLRGRRRLRTFGTIAPAMDPEGCVVLFVIQLGKVLEDNDTGR